MTGTRARQGSSDLGPLQAGREEMSSRPWRGSRAMVSVLAFSLVAAACGSEGGANAPELVRSRVPRAKALGDDAITGGAVADTVAAKLYPLFAQQAGGKNLAYSPASIA